ncbi:MAG: zf-HC2 domain-containing protein [Bacteroidota bacterium]
MNHKELQLLVSSYLDDEVSEADKETVLSHIKVCPECHEFVEHANKIREDIRVLGEVDLPYTFAAHVSHSIERRDEQVKEWLGVEPLARNTFFALAIVVLVIFMFTSIIGSSSGFTGDQLLSGYSTDSVSTRVLLQQDRLSKSDLLYAVMTK